MDSPIIISEVRMHGKESFIVIVIIMINIIIIIIIIIISITCYWLSLLLLLLSLVPLLSPPSLLLCKLQLWLSQLLL